MPPLPPSVDAYGGWVYCVMNKLCAGIDCSKVHARPISAAITHPGRTDVQTATGCDVNNELQSRLRRESILSGRMHLSPGLMYYHFNL